MNERKDGSEPIHESKITDIDLELLSLAEHYFIGSGVSMNGASEAPLSPVALIKQEMTNSAIYHMREARHWIRSNSADLELLGVVNVERYTVLFELSEFDVVTGEIDGLPTLHGVYDYEEKKIIKDEEKLASLGVNEEKAKNFTEARIGHFFPKGVFTREQTYS